VVTVDDIAGAVGARLAATTGFTTAVPGGIFLGRAPATPADHPYAVIEVDPGDAEVFSGDLSVQRFEVRVGVYCPVGDSGVNVGTVEQLLNTALASSAGNTAMQGSSLRNATDKILHSIPVRPEGEYAPSLREGRDVWRAGVAVGVLAQSDRGVA
jgi:hypothetical protein